MSKSAAVIVVLHLLVYFTIGVLSGSPRDNCIYDSITKQSELDQFVESIRTNHNDSSCIELSLTGNNSYTLDIVDFMNVTSFFIANNGSLIMQGRGGKVDINCVSSKSDLNELLRILQPISNAWLVILDGLVFISCPVPVLIEEVSTVMVQNCVFL